MDPVKTYLIVGGPYHDIDFVRIELLKLLNEHERIRVRVAEDYSDVAAIEESEFLLTYTIDRFPNERQREAVDHWLANGKRWFALHGTNSVLEFKQDGTLHTPRRSPAFVRMLGSQFLAHPPISAYDVIVTEPEHPLVRGIPPSFRVIDELYLSEYYEISRVLLHTYFNGRASERFNENEWFSDEPRPVMYLRDHGRGEVLYLTLGHRRGRYDYRPFYDEYPDVQPGAWIQPSFYELLRRGIKWGAGLAI